MYVKIEPSGCCERKGLVQIRFSMYLDKGDYGYDKHFIKGQVCPFHNHFIYVIPETSDDEIMDMAEAYLHEAYIKWACDEVIDCQNYDVQFPFYGTLTQLTNILCKDDEEARIIKAFMLPKIQACEKRVNEIKELKRTYNGQH